MKAVGTRAVELVQNFVLEVGFAGSVVQTWVFHAADEGNGAVLTAEVELAFAEVVGLAVHALAVHAGVVLLALVDVDLAVGALEALVALAVVAAHLVHAGAREAGRALALVDVDLAVRALHARYTHAFVPGNDFLISKPQTNDNIEEIN